MHRHLTLKKSQRFLVDKHYINRIVESGNINENDTVLEIGPGSGTLTSALLATNCSVIAIEKDFELYNFLVENQKHPRLKLVYGDALKIDFPPFNKVVSNLPYYISTPITFKILNYKFDVAVLMYQYDFAVRLVAQPGEENYSRLTLAFARDYDVELLFKVPRTCFRPQPKVDSAVVRIRPVNEKFTVIDESLYQTLIDLGFQHRRKKLATIIKHFQDKFKLDDIQLKTVLDSCSALDKRIEVLAPREIAEVADMLFKVKNN